MAKIVRCQKCDLCVVVPNFGPQSAVSEDCAEREAKQRQRKTK